MNTPSLICRQSDDQICGRNWCLEYDLALCGLVGGKKVISTKVIAPDITNWKFPPIFHKCRIS